MQPDLDDFLDYHDFNKTLARCRLRSYQSPAGLVVVLTELADNPGASITNSLEAVLKAVCQRFSITEDDAIILEHYCDESYEGGRGHTSAFARMKHGGFTNGNRWQAIPLALVTDLIGPEILEGATEEFPA